MFLELLSLCAGFIGFGAALATGSKLNWLVGLVVGGISWWGVRTLGLVLTSNMNRFKSIRSPFRQIIEWLIIPLTLVCIILLATLGNYFAAVLLGR